MKNASRFGNKFYLCKVKEINLDSSFCYPNYYNNIFKDMNTTLEKLKKEAFWIRITDIIEVEPKVIDNFKTYNKKTSIYESAMHLYQVSTMYGSAEKSIKI